MVDYLAKQLMLSSSSPRRAELLKQIGLDFSVSHPEVDETPIRGEAPDIYVARLALSKAKVGWTDGFISLGADTIVVHEGKLLGRLPPIGAVLCRAGLPAWAVVGRARWAC